MAGKSITTRRGDDGSTGLLDGRRVAKYDLRPEAYGTLDEAHAFIGLARSRCGTPQIADLLLMMQNHLYLINAELACPPDQLQRLPHKLGAAELADLEAPLAEIEAKLQLPPRFVLYGQMESSALLDVARAVVRRGERRVLELHAAEPLANSHLLPYLNRLSDALFLLARYEEKLHDVAFVHPSI